MISYQEALQRILSNAPLKDTELIGLRDSLGRVLAENVVSDVDMPPFNKASMDGYACKRSDLDKILKVVDVIPAGKVSNKTIQAGECAKIMTGAKVPDGADCVIMIEYVKHIDDFHIQFIESDTANNISYKAEEVKIGQTVLNANTLIRPEHIAIMASVGHANPLVYKKVSVGIIATGDELVDLFEKPQPGQIRNSNGYQLEAQVKKAGAYATYYGVAKDNEQVTEQMLSIAFQENDIVLLSGGVSMGEFDFVAKAMKKMGVEIIIEKVAIKPGKPTIFGKYNQKFVFGLPGNPVSTYVIFDLLAKPFILKMMGIEDRTFHVSLKLKETIKRDKADRMAWQPIKINQNFEVEPVTYHGSAHVHAMCFADGLICMEIGQNVIEKGAMVHVRLL